MCIVCDNKTVTSTTIDMEIYGILRQDMEVTKVDMYNRTRSMCREELGWQEVRMLKIKISIVTAGQIQRTQAHKPFGMESSPQATWGGVQPSHGKPTQMC